MTKVSGIFYSYFVVLSGVSHGSPVGLLTEDLLTDFCNDLTYPTCILFVDVKISVLLTQLIIALWCSLLHNVHKFGALLNLWSFTLVSTAINFTRKTNDFKYSYKRCENSAVIVDSVNIYGGYISWKNADCQLLLQVSRSMFKSNMLTVRKPWIWQESFSTLTRLTSNLAQLKDDNSTLKAETSGVAKNFSFMGFLGSLPRL